MPYYTYRFIARKLARTPKSLRLFPAAPVFPGARAGAVDAAGNVIYLEYIHTAKTQEEIG